MLAFALPPSLFHVVHVVLPGAHTKVSGIHAPAVITTVPDLQALRNLSVLTLVSITMSIHIYILTFAFHMK